MKFDAVSVAPSSNNAAMSKRFPASARYPKYTLALLLWFGLSPLNRDSLVAEADSGVGTDAVAAEIQKIADDFRNRLEISGEVAVKIVPWNDRLVSVTRSRENPAVFILSFEEAFLETLDEVEVRAAVAHEMGHVWIFHNHPFLQTEALANRKAEKLVSRECLELVYRKVWLYKGERGDIDLLLPPPGTAIRPEAPRF